MKRLITLSALALLLGITSSSSCSIPVETAYTLQPNSVQQVYFDFTDCLGGVNSFRISVTKPRDTHGTARDLPPSTPLAIQAVNLSNGEVAVVSGFTAQFSGNVAGGLIQLTLTCSGSKPLSVLVSTSENFGGQ